jgi:surface antigen
VVESLPPSRRSAAQTPSSAATAPAVYVVTAAKPKKKSLQSRIVGAFTVLVVPGFIVATSLPALALGTAGGTDVSGSSTSYSVANSQSVVVASDIDGATVSRDAFDATTQAEIDAAEAAKVAKAAAKLRAAQSTSAFASSGAYRSVGPRAAGDDYPWRGSSAMSPLAYVASQCTDFVAWRLNRDAGYTSAPFKYVWSTMTPGSGSAWAWAGHWKRNGWKTSNTPVSGAVAWFNGNHVAYVKSVSGSKVVLEEYNWNSDRSYHTRTIPSSSVALFLYPPP